MYFEYIGLSFLLLIKKVHFSILVDMSLFNFIGVFFFFNI